MYGIDRAGWNLILILAFLGITFGIWKIVEILIWLFSHIKIV